MGATARRTWQKREAQAAAIFGSKRQYGSGSGGREDETSSDSKHANIYLEGKLRATHSVLTLWRDTHKKAQKEGKTAVVVLSEKSKPGQWLLVHTADLAAVVANWLASQDVDTHTAVLEAAARYRVAAESAEDSQEPGSGG